MSHVAGVDHYNLCTSSWDFCLLVPLYFTDIDECELDVDDCDVNSDCVNTEGSYECVCLTGYSSNGETCMSKATE